MRRLAAADVALSTAAPYALSPDTTWRPSRRLCSPACEQSPAFYSRVSSTYRERHEPANTQKVHYAMRLARRRDLRIQGLAQARRIDILATDRPRRGSEVESVGNDDRIDYRAAGFKIPAAQLDSWRTYDLADPDP